jgi:hypothetical protein
MGPIQKCTAFLLSLRVVHMFDQMTEVVEHYGLAQQQRAFEMAAGLAGDRSQLGD